MKSKCDILDGHPDWVCIGLQSGTIVSELNAKDFIYRCLAEKEKSLFIYIEIDRLVIKYWKSYRAVLLVSQIASSCGYGSGVTRHATFASKTYAPMVTGWPWLDVASPLPQ